MKKWLPFSIVLLVSMLLVACGLEVAPSESEQIENVENNAIEIAVDGIYTNQEDVATYIFSYGKLPDNFITKAEARELGWEASEGNLWDVTDEMSIGGDRFFNREGQLPEADGRQYYEADINYEGSYRGAERIVYSNDGLIYYTPDHYETFTLLYGDE